MIQNFSNLVTVPQWNELIDTCLSSTNRKTPTVIRSKFDIHRIRKFYERKVKFASEQFISRLKRIVEDFPVLEDLHPFYMDLIGVLYDRDHYKIALGQVNSTSHVIEKIAKEHLRILNFGDSLYKCKEIKKTALGKMASAVKKLSKPLVYLEEVRQHMSRLPSLDTQARSIIICGFPNVGKSSFMNKMTRANVEVQNYPFTTRNIYVGHFIHNNLEWQVVDTPGILDKPLEERNSVEMLSITALAHLKAAILFFIDVSESCGYTVEEQVDLFNNLTPLLNLEIIVVLSKCDLLSSEELKIITEFNQNNDLNQFYQNTNGLNAFNQKVHNENDSDVYTNLHIEGNKLKILKDFLAEKKYTILRIDDENTIENVRDTVCAILLNARIAEKEDRKKEVMHRIKPYIPTVEKNKKISDQPLCVSTQNDQDIVDVIPEFYEGKNIADYLRPDILEEISNLEKEAEGERLRDFDIMTKEEQEKYQECNNARLEAIAHAHLARKAKIPESWKNERLPAFERKVKPIIKIEKESFNKKVRKFQSTKPFDKNPRHLLRPKGNKFAKK